MPPPQEPDDALARSFARADAAFELFNKLGVEYYTFHDRDAAPDVGSLVDTNAALRKACTRRCRAARARAFSDIGGRR